MSESEIPPALTPAQWKTVRSLETDCESLDAVTFLEIVLGTDPPPHAAAAALLFDRPFGFTEEMAAALATLVGWMEREAESAGTPDEVRRAVAVARRAEARIRALLPDPGGSG